MLVVPKAKETKLSQLQQSMIGMALPLLDNNGHVPFDESGHVPPNGVGHVPLDDWTLHDVDAILDEWIRTAAMEPDLPSLQKDEMKKGRAAGVQKFYQGRPKCKCCVNWVEKPPQQVPDDAQEKYDGVAIQVYHNQDHSKKTVGNLHTVSPGWVVFQSPVILQVLEPLFKKFGGVDALQGKITLVPPFQDLF
ncbi:hypothetical protein FB567DRAFT_436088, partial [Paraphoma chrysanthemicola]